MSSSSGSVFTVGELLPRISRDQADLFVREWLGGVSGIAVVTRISSAGRHIVRSWPFEVPELLGMINRADNFESLAMDDGGTWNVYVSCSTHGVDPTLGGKKRGGRSTVKGVHGVWLDLDVKDESFADGSAIDAFLKELPVAPSIVVDSGSGGRHVYWRFAEGPLSVENGEKVAEAWWALAQETAGEVYIDKITTADRIMRLPGTVRWPKVSGEQMGCVEVLRTGARCKISDVWDPAVRAYERLQERRATTRYRVEHTTELSNVTLKELAAKAGWNKLWALAHIEQIFNEDVSWDSILIPFGWHFVGTDNEGRRHWGRPGQDGKSAHTDYPPSPDVMSLFSNSPETGLAALKDADVPLTKFRVYCQLAFAGDAEKLIETLLRSDESVTTLQQGSVHA